MRIVVRYAEIALKGGNRIHFEKQLAENIRRHLKHVDIPSKVIRFYGRMVVENEGEENKVIEVLKHIPGIANFSLTIESTHDIKEMGKVGLELLKEKLGEDASPTTFKVEARRADKKHPLKSFEIAREVGAEVLPHFPQLNVDLNKPELVLGVEVWEGGKSILFLDKIEGQGGLPVGSASNVISLISGGIDSPVSSWMMMKRGCKTVFLTFQSYPFTTEEAKQKVIDLVEKLSRYQPYSTLIVAPFAHIQKEIQQKSNERNRTLLYRRMMYKIAEAIKDQYKVKAYVTGEAVGQVASQTIENIACTEEAATVPVIRPLIGMEKAEIIKLSQSIGTYQISIQPYDDCCTVFQPRKPETKGRVKDLVADNEMLDQEPLIKESIENLEIFHFKNSITSKFWN